MRLDVNTIDLDRGIQVKVSDLESIIESIKSSSFISVVTKTDPRMKKTDNPYFGNVEKITKYSSIVNFNYEKGINRRRTKEMTPTSFNAKEGFFTIRTRSDGTMTPICVNKTDPTKKYLRMQVLKSSSCYKDKNTGQEINKKVLEPWLYQNNYNHQGLDNPLVIVTPGIENIISMKANGKFYTVV